MDNWSRIFSPADLGLAIQAARTGKGWSQRDLAQRTGIAQSAISDLESGKHTLYAERLFTLLNACEIGLKAEWKEDDEPGR
ncbi:MAG: helix-turn-helix transcriptional regulator [Propionibacteriaceae bacterium]|nr:helix-turn-helix transcriptional regulator [Propionibacteriaceae bacterium]